MSGGGPLFIVGPSRSGTTLLVRALNRGRDIRVAPETHYFEDLRPRMRGAERGPLDEARRRTCENYFLALSHRPYGQAGDPERGQMDRAALRERAACLGDGADAYFQGFCELVADAADRPRWGEKTPRHVYAIDDILERFPDGRIVGLVRDPRAVIASYRDWENQYRRGDADAQAAIAADHARSRASYSLAVQGMLWRSAIRAGESACDRWGDGRVRLVRYEDLVARPETEVADLCEWLGAAFDPGMIDLNVANSSYLKVGTRGVKAEAASAWQGRLTDDELAVAQALTGGVARRWGYEPERVPNRVLPVLRAALDLPGGLVRALRANRGRIGNLGAFLLRRAKTLVGRS